MKGDEKSWHAKFLRDRFLRDKNDRKIKEKDVQKKLHVKNCAFGSIFLVTKQRRWGGAYTRRQCRQRETF